MLLGFSGTELVCVEYIFFHSIHDNFEGCGRQRMHSLVSNKTLRVRTSKSCWKEISPEKRVVLICIEND